MTVPMLADAAPAAPAVRGAGLSLLAMLRFARWWRYAAAQRESLGIVRDNGVRDLQQVAHARVGDCVDDRSAASLTGDVAAPFETREVVTHVALTNSESDHELADIVGSLEQHAHDFQTGRIGEALKELRVDAFGRCRSRCVFCGAGGSNH